MVRYLNLQNVVFEGDSAIVFDVVESLDNVPWDVRRVLWECREGLKCFRLWDVSRVPGALNVEAHNLAKWCSRLNIFLLYFPTFLC